MHINTTTLQEIKQNSSEPIFTDKKLTLEVSISTYKI